MKKILATMLAAALAGGAWGDAQPVVNSVRSSNLFGALEVTGVASNMFVAVPFEEFDGSGRAVSGVVHPSNLKEEDALYAWDYANKRYNVYTLEGGEWTAAKKATVAVDGTVTFGESSDPATTGVPAGTGVILERADTSLPVYVYGQLPESPSATVQFGAGQTLVCAPSTKAMEDVDLNTAATWTGVTAATGNSAGTLVKTKKDKDYIYFRDANNKIVRYYYLDGKWGPDYRVGWDDKAVVPAGTAFWYWSKAGGAKASWEL